MSDIGSGRLRGELGPRTRRVIYGELSAPELAAELPTAIRVDRAHVVMLAECRLIAAGAARALLRCIDDLEASGYTPLLGRPAPRGLYLMYEGYLIEQLGAGVGGVLHSGRSRNDLKATVTKLRFRDWLLDFAEEAIRLEAVLLNRARMYQSVVMPVYTHFQAAMPVTYGYYLLGVALALGRDIEALRSASAGLQVCPLGAGAVAGTDLPIDPSRTADLLGFSSTTGHALDAVASRDVPLRLLAAATSLAVTLSRLATDLQLWSTAEFGFIGFPDRLVGGSSAMPQKRNAFLLEHVKAKSGHASGAFAAASGMMSAVPFTNSIEVGTEAVAAIWPGLYAVEQSVLLTQVLVSGARPDPDRMIERAQTGFTAATSIANRLVREGVPFRTAHNLVGDAVRRAIEAGSTDLAEFLPPGTRSGPAQSGSAQSGLAQSGPASARDSAAPDQPGTGRTDRGPAPMDQPPRDGRGQEPAPLVQPRDSPGGDLSTLVRAHEHGGGPGSFAESHRQAAANWARSRDWLAEWRESLADASSRLTEAVRAQLEEPPG